MAPTAEPVPSAVEDQYFSSNPPPKALPHHIAQAQDFIDFHVAAGRRVVLVTSGGTTVPLEKQTVRFIDNFSAGTRGATSAEYFLESGYAVIFLHRQFSLLPYSRHYSHATDCFLDFLHEGPGGAVLAKPEYTGSMLSVLRKYHAARSNNLLLTLPFVTIGDYLHELRAIARLMHRLGPDGLLYLAAAASDFFLPQDRMAEHKIQSTDAADKARKPASVSGGGVDEEFDNFDSSPKVPRSKRLIVDLDPVPKFLKNLVDGWAPQCMIVSFKLETDPGELPFFHFFLSAFFSFLFLLLRALLSILPLYFLSLSSETNNRLLSCHGGLTTTSRNPGPQGQDGSGALQPQPGHRQPAVHSQVGGRLRRARPARQVDPHPRRREHDNVRPQENAQRDGRRAQGGGRRVFCGCRRG